MRFFVEFLNAGFDILCSDLDVMWLSDPRPWVMGRAASSDLLSFAEVIVSTDVTSGGAENDMRAWGVADEMNTGMVLLRSTPGAMAFCFASQSLFPPALETLHQPATYHHMNSVVRLTMGLTLVLHLLLKLGL